MRACGPPAAWIGSGPTGQGHTGGISLLTLGGADGLEPSVRHVIDAEAPTFLAAHPTLPRLYAVQEVTVGAVASFEILPGAGLRRTAELSSGGAQPCHVLVHPSGRWLYVSNYGDGSVAAIRLSAAGDLFGRPVVLKHSGSGPVCDRQESSHAHSSVVSPCGRYLVVADLGTDELRAYILDDGEPVGPSILTAMPPGFGPRSMEVLNDHVYITGELAGEVAVVTLDRSGRGRVVQRLRNSRAATASKTPARPSHVVAVPAGLLVGVRGSDSILTLGVRTDGVQLDVASEAHTVASPRHMAVVGGAVVVAGQLARMLAVHPMRSDGAIDRLVAQFPFPAPMCILSAKGLKHGGP